MNSPSTQSQSAQKQSAKQNCSRHEASVKKTPPPEIHSEIQPAQPEQEATRYVGLDVHKKQITYCILNGNGTVLKEGEIALTRERLEAFAAKKLRPGDQVALETTTNCWAVVDVLQQHVPHVVVSNPMATKAIAQSKIKTDKVDANVLAQLLR